MPEYLTGCIEEENYIAAAVANNQEWQHSFFWRDKERDGRERMGDLWLVSENNLGFLGCLGLF